MNIIVKPQKTYNISINHHTYKNCIIESKWEGLVKFRTPCGKIIIAEEVEGNLDKFFSFVLNQEDDPKEFRIIKASPDFWLEGEE